METSKNFQKILKISEIALTAKKNYGKIIPINKESRNINMKQLTNSTQKFYFSYFR
jgi:hypothetical protein